MSNRLIQDRGHVYRFLTLQRALEIFQRQATFFACPRQWEAGDPYEVQLAHPGTEQLVAQCWCQTAISDAMSRLYAPQGRGVRVGVKRWTLAAAVRSWADENALGYRDGPVFYRSAPRLRRETRALGKRLRHQFDLSQATDVLFLKREAFSHENEAPLTPVARRYRSVHGCWFCHRVRPAPPDRRLRSSRMATFFALLTGLVFGIGLIVSGMANPEKVLGFLDLAGDWDPSLAFVMAGAIAVGAIAFTFARKRTVSLLGLQMKLPTSTQVDRRLVAGGLMFGVGWGIAGFCPGPALVALGSGEVKAVVFVVAMLVGMGVFELLERRAATRGGAGPTPNLGR